MIAQLAGGGSSQSQSCWCKLPDQAAAQRRRQSGGTVRVRRVVDGVFELALWLCSMTFLVEERTRRDSETPLQPIGSCRRREERTPQGEK